MSIVSSTYTQDAHTQANGERYVVEYHTDSESRVHQVGPWLAPVGFDVAARVAERAVALAEQLAEAEAEGIINGA